MHFGNIYYSHAIDMNKDQINDKYYRYFILKVIINSLKKHPLKTSHRKEYTFCTTLLTWLRCILNLFKNSPQELTNPMIIPLLSKSSKALLVGFFFFGRVPSRNMESLESGVFSKAWILAAIDFGCVSLLPAGLLPLKWQVTHILILE